MRRDPRIHLDPTTRGYHAKIAADEAAVEASVSETRWLAMLASLGDVVLSRVSYRRVEVPHFPPGGDPRFRNAFDHIARRLAEEDDRQSQPLEQILARRLAEYVGIHLPTAPVDWDMIVSRLHDWKDWQAFVQAVPVETIRAHLADLTRMPADLRSCIDSFGALRENFQAALQTLDERRTKEPDDWRWLDAVERFADEATLAPEMALRSELLARLGALHWLSWATSFPHAVLVASAVNDVDDLDFVEELIEHRCSASSETEQGRIALLLLIRRSLELWERIGRSLERAANVWGVGDADRAEISRMNEQWSQVELPARCGRLASTLVASVRGMNAAIEAVRHLRSRRQVPPSKTPSGVQLQLRDCLLDELRKGHLDEVLGRLVDPPALSASVLAAALLVLSAPTPQRLEAAFQAYLDWLASEDFYWVGPLEGHDRDIVNAAAAMLASMPAAVEDARRLLASAQCPPQGWGFEFDAWFQAVPKITHLLIVVAGAAVGVPTSGNGERAPELMDLAWRNLDLLLRAAPIGNADGHVSSAVAYVWAYASKVFSPSDRRLSVAIARFDDVRLMISAARNFKANAGALSSAAQESLRLAFDTRLPILERHPHVTPEALADLRREVAELTT
jgi:hypothetical protein